jgi:anti-sigma factor RsiW
MLRFMREHRFAQARLSEYLDGELGGQEQRRVHEHIELCPDCRRVLEQLRRTVAALARLGERRTDGPVADGVIARLRTEG